MKTIIVYAGKYGCTEDCVIKLKSKLDGEVNLVNAAKDKVPSLAGYDSVVIGSSIYVGQIHKKVKSFIDNNLNMLLEKKISLFLVCGFIEKFDETVAANFPKALIDNAQSIECFGGELNIDKMNFLHKGVVKMIEKEVDISKIKTMPENIEKLANQMR